MAALGAAGRDRLVERLAPIVRRIVAAGAISFPNAMALPRLGEQDSE